MFSKFSAVLKDYGFVQSASDYSLFTMPLGSSSIYVLVYVDVLIVFGSDLVILTGFKTYLQSCFHMKDLGNLNYFLGIEMARSPQGIVMSQCKYTLDIIADCRLLGFKLVIFPM